MRDSLPARVGKLVHRLAGARTCLKAIVVAHDQPARHDSRTEECEYIPGRPVKIDVDMQETEFLVRDFGEFLRDPSGMKDDTARMLLEVRCDLGKAASQIAHVPMGSIAIRLGRRQAGERIEQMQALFRRARRNTLGQKVSACAAKHSAFCDIALERESELEELPHSEFAIKAAIVASIEALVIS